MKKLSDQQREFLEAATAHYQSEFNDKAYDYLVRTRGEKVADRAGYYRLGYVETPLDGHERMANRLAIPYVTPAGVVDLRWRCLDDHDCKEVGCPKYLGSTGGELTLFNTRALFYGNGAKIALTEGEMGALAVEQECHIPAVGYPGVSSWESHRFWRKCFAGFQVVYVIADGDEPGREGAQKIMRDLPNARLVQMPDGLDETEAILEHGPMWMLERMGLLRESE